MKRILAISLLMIALVYVYKFLSKQGKVSNKHNTKNTEKLNSQINWDAQDIEFEEIKDQRDEK